MRITAKQLKKVERIYTYKKTDREHLCASIGLMKIMIFSCLDYTRKYAVVKEYSRFIADVHLRFTSHWLPPNSGSPSKLTSAFLPFSHSFSAVMPMRFLANWMYSQDKSVPIPHRPSWLATATVVPLPENGSKTTAGTVS